MNFVEENLLGLIVIIVLVIGLSIWVLRSRAPTRTTFTRDETARPTLSREPPRPTAAPITPVSAAPSPVVPEAAPTMTPPQETPPSVEGPADDLTRMKGVGPKVITTLAGLGVTRYDQIASWTDADIDRVDAQLGAFKGRVRRDQWVEQAKLLAAGDTAGYQEKFGRL